MIGREPGTNGGRRSAYEVFLGGGGGTGVDGRIILKQILKIWDGSMDYIYLIQKRGKCRAPVNAL
jgi:hypothetical protein